MTVILPTFTVPAAIWVVLCLDSQLALAQDGDGGAASGNLPGNNNGAQGPDRSSANISIGATIAIAVIVGVVVILGACTACLFFSAKRRQWTIREQLRHSRRRVTTGLKTMAAPLTPGRGLFSPVKTKFSTQETSGLRDLSPMRANSRPTRNFSRKAKFPKGDDQDALRGEDLEKGPSVVSSTRLNGPSRPQVSHDANKSKAKRHEMKIDLPKSDASVPAPPQTPMWNKLLGRT